MTLAQLEATIRLVVAYDLTHFETADLKLVRAAGTQPAQMALGPIHAVAAEEPDAAEHPTPEGIADLMAEPIDEDPRAFLNRMRGQGGK